MSKMRIFFLVPTIKIAKNIVDELLLARVPEKHMHVIAKNGTPLDDLPEASLLEKSDFKHALEKGLALGGLTGLLAGLVAVTFPPAGLVYAGGAVVLGSTLAGAGVGAWLSSMVGISLPNACLKRFQSAIDQGELLMFVEISHDKKDSIIQSIRRHHPEVDFGGLDPEYPVFP